MPFINCHRCQLVIDANTKRCSRCGMQFVQPPMSKAKVFLMKAIKVVGIIVGVYIALGIIVGIAMAVQGARSSVPPSATPKAPEAPLAQATPTPISQPSESASPSMNPSPPAPYSLPPRTPPQQVRPQTVALWGSVGFHDVPKFDGLSPEGLENAPMVTNLDVHNDTDFDWQDVKVAVNPRSLTYYANIGSIQAHGDGYIPLTDFATTTGLRLDSAVTKIMRVEVEANTSQGLGTGGWNF